MTKHNTARTYQHRADLQTAQELPVNQIFYKSSEDMAEIPDAAVALVVTSPPYFCIKDYSRNGHQDAAHSERLDGDYSSIDGYHQYIDALSQTWRECCRVLQPNGKLVVNAPIMPMPKQVISTHHNRNVFNIYSDIEQSILTGIDDLHLMDVYIWNRTNPTKSLMFGSYPYPRNLYAQNTAEFIGVFVKGGKPLKPDPEAKALSALSASEWIEYTKQVWNIPIPSKADPGWGKHSAIMPKEIAKRCIRMFSFVGDLILDPFAGSGTTLKAAQDLQRNYVGYEIYQSYEPVILQKLASTRLPGESNATAE